mmetsp:Transcript_64656/g.154352  ORF Transcript_64656/g.154352 Transcript_64656/m.154352 type:complete len:325 (+) Transcript_64656:1042-2016(+)
MEIRTRISYVPPAVRDAAGKLSCAALFAKNCAGIELGPATCDHANTMLSLAPPHLEKNVLARSRTNPERETVSDGGEKVSWGAGVVSFVNANMTSSDAAPRKLVARTATQYVLPGVVSSAVPGASQSVDDVRPESTICRASSSIARQENARARGEEARAFTTSSEHGSTESVPETDSDGATGKGGASTRADAAEGRDRPFFDRTAPGRKVTVSPGITDAPASSVTERTASLLHEQRGAAPRLGREAGARARAQDEWWAVMEARFDGWSAVSRSTVPDASSAADTRTGARQKTYGADARRDTSLLELMRRATGALPASKAQDAQV